MENWLQAWERIYEEYKTLNLPDVADIRAVYDFLLIVTAVDPIYGGIQKALVSEKISKDPDSAPTLHDAIEGYRNHLRLTRAVTAKVSSHSAFAIF